MLQVDSDVLRLQTGKGTVPDSWLALSDNDVNAVRDPSDGGSVPVNEFLARFNAVNAGNWSQMSGMVPLNSLSSMRIAAPTVADTPAREFGMLPDSR